MKSYLHIRKSTAAIAAGALITVAMNLLLGATSHAQGTTTTAPATVWDGIYTAAQAARGKAFYTQTCSPCHGDEPVGTANAPSLSGTDFMKDFVDSSVFDVWNLIVTTMPASNPGSVTPPQAADVFAYLSEFNKWPAGEKELPPDADALKKIKIVEKK